MKHALLDLLKLLAAATVLGWWVVKVGLPGIFPWL